jgi:hypothetical protein
LSPYDDPNSFLGQFAWNDEESWYDDDGWGEHDTYDGDYDLYWTEDGEWESYDTEWESDVPAAADTSGEQYWKGKGKGKGKSSGRTGLGGCTNCGSKYHNGDNCPNHKESSKGGSSFGKGKGKSRKGKGKGGKSKGKGKFRSRKGKGKGKGKFGKGKTSLYESEQDESWDWDASTNWSHAGESWHTRTFDTSSFTGTSTSPDLGHAAASSPGNSGKSLSKTEKEDKRAAVSFDLRTSVNSPSKAASTHTFGDPVAVVEPSVPVPPKDFKRSLFLSYARAKTSTTSAARPCSWKQWASSKPQSSCSSPSQCYPSRPTSRSCRVPRYVYPSKQSSWDGVSDWDNWYDDSYGYDQYWDHTEGYKDSTLKNKDSLIDPGCTQHLHSVAGRKRRGLLVDPGASSGVVGTDTLLELLEVMESQGRRHLHKVEPSTQSMCGIDGEPVPSGGLHHTVFDLPGGGTIEYEADAIGNEESRCPALLPNPSLIRNGISIFFGYFVNGDGLMFWKKPDGLSRYMVRLLLTDSQHYLLPCDSENDSDKSLYEDSALKETVATINAEAYHQASSRWQDIKPIYFQQIKADISQNLCRGYAYKGKDNSSASHLATEKKVDTASADTPPVSDAVMATEQLSVSDKNTLASERKQIRVSSKDDSPALKRCAHDTNFKDTSLSLKARNVSADVSNFKAQNSFENQFPKHFTDDDLKLHSKKYLGMPEQYYSRRPYIDVVTPENCTEWVAGEKKRCQAWDFWELCSGSSILSHTAETSKLKIGFPVDFRYGWDLSHEPHRELLLWVREQMKPKIIFTAMDCRVWSVAGRRRHDLHDARAREIPYLKWIFRINKLQADAGLVFINENPLGSAIWTDSPLARNSSLRGYKSKQRCHQCQHGAVNEEGVPVQKGTRFDANVRLRHSCLICNGHRSSDGSRLDHASLNSRAVGSKLPRTAMAAMFPVKLARALVKDVVICLKSKEFIGDYGNPKESFEVSTLAETLGVATSEELRPLSNLNVPVSKSTSPPPDCDRHQKDSARGNAGQVDLLCEDLGGENDRLRNNNSGLDSEIVEHENFWSCPRCKGVKEHEHTRVPGKCRAASSPRPPNRISGRDS